MSNCLFKNHWKGKFKIPENETEEEACREKELLSWKKLEKETLKRGYCGSQIIKSEIKNNDNLIWSHRSDSTSDIFSRIRK